MSDNMEDSNYDPETCVTAGELRRRGIQISPTIPDCAWTPHKSVKLSVCQGLQKSGSDSPININVVTEFTEPFRWLEVMFTSQ